MAEEKVGFFKRLVNGLTKTRDSIVAGIDSIFSGYSNIDDDFYEELEEILIMSDIGVNTTEEILDNLKEQVKENKIKEPIECKELLIKNIEEQMDLGENAYDFENEKSVILMIGVNGVGKTTSIGKLASQFKNNGKKVVLAAADTFRAAAADQLKEWANRANVDIVMGAEGSDPGSVLYDAISSAKNKNADILLCDTAGRLHNKKNLREELKKINRIIDNRKRGKRHHIIINAEGIGHSASMAKRIEAATGIETRATILGYMQRGGAPTCKDRVYASIMGAKAVELLEEGKTNRVVAYKHGEFLDFDIQEALNMKKDIPEDQYEISKLLIR